MKILGVPSYLLVQIKQITLYINLFHRFNNKKGFKNLVNNIKLKQYNLVKMIIDIVKLKKV
jgi:hypothetical protein